MKLEKQITTAGTANTAKKQCLMLSALINHWLTTKNLLKPRFFAVPAVFAVVR